SNKERKRGDVRHRQSPCNRTRYSRAENLLRLHHGEPAACALRRDHESHRNPSAPAQRAQVRRFHCEVQREQPCLFRAVRLSRQSHPQRKRTEELASREENRSDRIYKSQVARSELWLVSGGSAET